MLPDVIIVDIDDFSNDCFKIVRDIKQHLPNIGVIIISSNDDDEHIFRALKSQAAAYLFCGGKVDLSPMEAGDIVDVRIQTKLEAADTYKTIWHETYNGVQPEDGKVVKVPAMPDNFGLEVSMRQTAGPLKFILCEFFDAKQ